MKSYIVKYIFFKLIKSIEVSSNDYNSAIKEFNNLLPFINKKHIVSVIKLTF